MLLSLHFPSLQYRWVISLTSLGAGALTDITGSIDPSSLSLHPFPYGKDLYESNTKTEHSYMFYMKLVHILYETYKTVNLHIKTLVDIYNSTQHRKHIENL